MLDNVVRCQGKLGEADCGSPVFYDWGIELLTSEQYSSVRGGNIERYSDFGSRTHVKICARCTTPYIMEAGQLVDISAELTSEDVKAILARGQATLPHVKVKDP